MRFEGHGDTLLGGEHVARKPACCSVGIGHFHQERVPAPVRVADVEPERIGPGQQDRVVHH